MYGQHLQHSMNQPSKAAKPAQGQLNRENNWSPCPRSRLACGFGVARRSWPSRIALARTFATLRLNMVPLEGFQSVCIFYQCSIQHAEAAAVQMFLYINLLICYEYCALKIRYLFSLP